MHVNLLLHTDAATVNVCQAICIVPKWWTAPGEKLQRGPRCRGFLYTYPYLTVRITWAECILLQPLALCFLLTQLRVNRSASRVPPSRIAACSCSA